MNELSRYCARRILDHCSSGFLRANDWQLMRPWAMLACRNGVARQLGNRWTVGAPRLEPWGRTRNDVIETQRMLSNEYEKATKSTKAIDVLPLITVWLQVASCNELNSPSAIVCSPEEPSPQHSRSNPKHGVATQLSGQSRNVSAIFLLFAWASNRTTRI